MMYLERPADFQSKFEITSCFIEHKGKFLLLHRCDNKPEGNTWGAPAGKVHDGETLQQATLRELAEETGVIFLEKDLKYWGKVFVKYAKYDFVYHIFSASLPPKTTIKINNKEHKNFKWVTPTEALKLPLIQDEDTSIKIFYKLM